MKSWILAFACLLSVIALSAADKPKKPAKPKPLTPAQKQALEDIDAAEKKAIAQYDDLPVEFREKAIGFWKFHFESRDKMAYIPAPKNPKSKAAVPPSDAEKFLVNSPPIYPGIMTSNSKGNPILVKDAWGEFDPRVYVHQVISKTRVLCKADDFYWIVDGIDATDLIDEQPASFAGLFFVSGTEKHGGFKTVFVVKPLKKLTPEEMRKEPVKPELKDAK